MFLIVYSKTRGCMEAKKRQN
uniref:Uncharacterized protein n=1 Tax=Rhizophora mucronata TaxID=61149 RepID=A0A2P2N2K4_RHIMU